MYCIAGMFYKCIGMICAVWAKMQTAYIPVMLTFDDFRDRRVWDGQGSSESWRGGQYEELGDVTFNIAVIMFHLVMDIAVYASGIAVTVSAILLIWNARNRNRLGESKKYVVQVMIISILIFSVTNMVNLVQKLAA